MHSEVANGGSLYIKLFLKILQYSQETPVSESPFNKVSALKAGCFIKKTFQQKVRNGKYKTS